MAQRSLRRRGAQPADEQRIIGQEADRAAHAFCKYVLGGREPDYSEFRRIISQQQGGRQMSQDERFMIAFCREMRARKGLINEFLDAYLPEGSFEFGAAGSAFLARTATADWMKFIDAVHETDAALRRRDMRAAEQKNQTLARFLRDRREADGVRQQAADAAAALFRFLNRANAADRATFLRLFDSNARGSHAELFRREAASAFCSLAGPEQELVRGLYAFLGVNPAKIILSPPPSSDAESFTRLAEGRLNAGDALRRLAEAAFQIHDADTRDDERRLESLRRQYGREFVESLRRRRWRRTTTEQMEKAPIRRVIHPR